MQIPTMEKIKDAGRKIGEKHGLRLVVLYGSVAKGMAKEDSDVDIAVLGKNFLQFKEIIEIIDEFTAALQSNKIDVKSLHHADPLFRHQVMEGGILLYGDELDFIKFKIYAFRDYVESKSLFDLKEKMVKKRLKMI
jgi:predicted nucleotidyltransferase